jgi:hypothetical protein
MDVDLARDMIRAAFRSSSELQIFLGVLKQRCSPEQYKDYSHGVAAAIDAIGVALINKALAAHPELTPEVEASIAQHGQYR